MSFNMIVTFAAWMLSGEARAASFDDWINANVSLSFAAWFILFFVMGYLAYHKKQRDSE